MEVSTQSSLYDRLADLGLIHFYLTFGEGNFRSDDWRLARDRLPKALAEAIDFFLLGELLARERICALIGEAALAELEEVGLLSCVGERVGLGSYRLGIFQKLCVFFEYSMSPRTYFGDDSVALGTYLLPPPGGAALDLCSGTGIQAMVAARSMDRATGVEINHVAARIARFNVRLNSLADRVTIVQQDLSDYLANATERWDLVCFNPPLLPVPKSVRFPFVGDGGTDGLELTRRIVSLARPRLAADGTIQFVGTGIGCNAQPTFVEQLGSLARQHGLQARVHLLSKQQLSPGGSLFEAMVTSASVDSGVAEFEMRKVLLDHYTEISADELYLFFCVMREGQAGLVTTVDTANSFFGTWFL